MVTFKPRLEEVREGATENVRKSILSSRDSKGKGPEAELNRRPAWLEQSEQRGERRPCVRKKLGLREEGKADRTSHTSCGEDTRLLMGATRATGRAFCLESLGKLVTASLK